MPFKDRSSSSGGFAGWVIHAVLRFLQFVFAITVAGLYGTDIDYARKHGGGGDSRWVSEVSCLGGSWILKMSPPGIRGGCRGAVCLDLPRLHGPDVEIFLPLRLGRGAVVSWRLLASPVDSDADSRLLASCGWLFSACLGRSICTWTQPATPGCRE